MASLFKIPPAEADGVVRIHKEMGITRREFVGLLPTAVKPATFVVTGGEIEVRGAAGRVSIRLSGDRERTIALLRLPVLDVDLELCGFDAAGLVDFMEQFDRTYQRGGG